MCQSLLHHTHSYMHALDYIIDQTHGVTSPTHSTLNSHIFWYGHVLRKYNDWVKKCMEYKVEGAKLTGLGERLSKKTVKHVN